MLGWLRSLGRLRGRPENVVTTEASAAAVAPAGRIGERFGPPDGEQWIYVEASDVDIASAVRPIDGVQKVTRERNGVWKVVANRDIGPEVARSIIVKGGDLSLLISQSQISKLGRVTEG